jgi:hypothetical protein
MKQDILIRVIYEGSTYDLDIDSGIPLRLDVSAVENQKIGKFFGVGSQTFDLPGTKTNNRFFKNPWTIGAEDIPALYNTITGYIIYNGETILEGQFQLLEIVNDDNGYINYKCQITDNVIQFNDNLADKLIIDADFSQYDHNLTSGSIIDSWSDNLLSGSIFYPLADYGRDDTIVFPSTPRIQVSGASTATGSIDNQISPMQVQQFLPTIRARDVIRAIFNQVDYNYTSSFIDGSEWDKLYLLPRAKEGLGIVGLVQENTLDVNMSVDQDLSILQPGGTVVSTLEFDTEIADPGNNYNSTTFTYTPPYTGVYVIDVSLELDVDAGQASPQTINLSFAGWGTTINLPAGTYTTTIRLNRRVTLTGGTPYNPKVTVTSTSPNADLELAVVSNSNNTYLRVPKALSIFDNAPVDMALQFESKTKSIDLLNGFIEHFNLVVTPEPGQDKTLRIETFDTWVSQGNNVDWTDKVNNAKRVAVSQTIEEQEKELRFTNAEDNDRFSVVTKQNDPNFQYGTQRVIASSNIPKGEKEIGKTFAPVILGSAIDSGSLNLDGVTEFNLGDSNFVIPHLYKYENNNQVAFKFKNRLGYKVDGLTPVGAFNNQIWIGNSGSAEAVSEYSTISNLSAVPAVSGTNDLHFSNDYGAFIPDDLNPYGGTDNYQNYWETYVNSLYWDGSKKLVVDIKFRQDEYKDIQLNDIIFVKDQRYRINKITGINLSNDDVARVELIRLFPAYYTDITVTTTTIPGTTTTTSTTSTTTIPVTTTTTTEPPVETYWSGSGCEEPFSITGLIVTTGSLSPGDAVKIGSNACYTLISTHEQEPFIKFYVQQVYSNCNDCLGITTTTTTIPVTTTTTIPVTTTTTIPVTTTTTTIPVTTTTTTIPVTTTTTTIPVTTTTTTIPGCYTYSIQNNDLGQTLTFGYTDCDGNPVADVIVQADSGTPDFCAEQNSVYRQSGTNSWVLTEEATSCTVTTTTTTIPVTTTTTIPVTTTTTIPVTTTTTTIPVYYNHYYTSYNYDYYGCTVCLYYSRCSKYSTN